ncbi:hypothetical protein ACI2IP_02860 [Microbacterium sp. NPDC090218]
MDTIGARLRIVTICHAVTGLLTAVWGAGLPALDARLDLGPATIGAMLLLVAGGALVTMRLAGRVHRSGGWMLSLALPSAGIALVVAGSAPTSVVLFLAAALFGLSCGVVNVALSSEAMAVESAIGRPVIARMHGFWTLGAAGGGMLLAAALNAGLDSRIAISGAAGVIVLTSLGIGPRIRAGAAAHPSRPPVPETSAASASASSAQISRLHLAALGLVGAAVFLTEGAATDWSGVHTTRMLGADPAIGSVVYGVFFSAMTVVRFCGDALRRRLGPVRTVRITMSVAVAGYALVLATGLVPTEPTVIVTAVIGWALAGAGSALVWPIVIGHLATAGETRRNLAFVTMISYGGGLLGPAVIGFLAQATSLSIALVLPAALALLVAVAAPATMRPPRVRRATSSPSATSSMSTTSITRSTS